MRYPTFLDYFRASSSPFDSHGSPFLDYKLQLPLLQRMLHRNAHEKAQRYRMKLKRILSHALRKKRWKEIARFFKYFMSIISFRRNKYGCIKYGQSLSACSTMHGSIRRRLLISVSFAWSIRNLFWHNPNLAKVLQMFNWSRNKST